jgi:F-type H+-transporting ATPase subunit epsilon
MKTFHLTVAKVGENLFDGEAISVSLPGSEGMFEILADHEAFVSVLVKGEVRIKSADEVVHTFPLVTGGVAEVSHNQATVLV